MRTFIILLALFSVVKCLAQNNSIQGRIVDSKTNQAIEGAYIFLPGNNTGTATNRNGEFEIPIPKGIKTQLVISALPYKSVIVKEIPATGSILLSLERQMPQRLKSLSPAQLVHECIAGFSENYQHHRTDITIFQREYVTSFENIIQYLEVSSNKRHQAEAEVSINNALYMEDKHQRDLFWNAGKGGFYTFGWSNMGEPEMPSTKCFLGVHLKQPQDIDRYYTFTLRGTIAAEDQKMYVIDFDQKNIKTALLKGTMYIDSLSKALVKVEYSISSKGYKYIAANKSIGGNQICKPPSRLELIRNDGAINFRKHDEGWVFQNSFSHVQFNVGIDSRLPGKNYLKMQTEASATNLDPSQATLNNTHASKLSTITYDLIKDNFETYSVSDTIDYKIKADRNPRVIAKNLARNNKLWQRTAERKAKEKLQTNTLLSSEESSADLEFMKETLMNLHPDLYRYTSKLKINNAFEKVRKRLTRDLSEDEFFKLIAPAIAQIHCEHTFIMPSKAVNEYEKTFGKYFPLDVVVEEGKLFIDEDPADTAGLAEVVRINEVNCSTIIQTLEDKVMTEGTVVSKIEHALSKQFADLYFKYVDQPDSFRLELRDHKNRLQSRTFAARPYRHHDSADDFNYHEIDSLQTGVIQLASGSDDHKISLFLLKSFQSLENKKLTNLIIDLRNNSSRNSGLATSLYPFLVEASSNYYDRIELASADTAYWNNVYTDQAKLSTALPDFWASINPTDSVITFSETKKQTRPSSLAPFNGNVYVLINSGTSTVAAELANILQSSRNAVVFGAEVPMSQCEYLSDEENYVTLPNSKMKLYLPVAKRTFARDVPLQVIPDYNLPPSINWALTSSDEGLLSVLKIIAQNCCTAKSD